MNIYKVYGQNINRPVGMAIIKIDSDDVKNEIMHVIDHLTDEGEINIIPESYFSDEQYSAYFEAIKKDFESTGILNCGDYCLMMSEDMPNRPNSCGDYITSKEFDMQTLIYSLTDLVITNYISWSNDKIEDFESNASFRSCYISDSSYSVIKGAINEQDKNDICSQVEDLINKYINA